jgi:hypothetical protein
MDSDNQYDNQRGSCWLLAGSLHRFEQMQETLPVRIRQFFPVAPKQIEERVLLPGSKHETGPSSSLKGSIGTRIPQRPAQLPQRKNSEVFPSNAKGAIKR